MFELTAASTLFRRTGFILLLLQLCLFIYGFPPFHMSFWVQVEPVLLAAFVFAYLSCAWLALGIAKRWLIPAPNAPLWWCMLLWVTWQLIATAFATTPWRSWFGPPEIGEGAGWHMTLLLMVMFAYPLLRIATYRKLILGIGVGIIALLATLHMVVPQVELADAIGSYSERFVSARFPKDIPFMAGYLWIAALCWQPIRSKFRYGVWLTAFGVLLWVTQNRTAMLFMGAALLAGALPLFLSSHRGIRRFFYPSRRWKIAALAACLLPFLWVAFSIHIVTFQPYLSEADTHSEFSITNKNGAIGGRIPFLQVAMRAMQHEPLRWLIGDGWGRFTDDTYQYALVDGVHLYQNGQYQPNWDALRDVPVVHSHCQPVEALLSLGLPGMILWFAIPMLALWHLPRRLFWPVTPMLVALVMLSYFWFEQAQDLPFRALALAALCHVSLPRTRANAPNMTVLILAITCLIMGWSAWQQREAMVYAQRLRTALLTSPAANYPEEWLTEDSKRGGDRLRQAAILYEILLTQEVKTHPTEDMDRGWYALFLRATHDYAHAPHSNPHAAATELLLMYKLFGALSVPSLAPLKWEIFPQIPDAVLLAARKAPLRDDIAATLLKNLARFTNNDPAKQLDFLHQLLAVNPIHRGALWVLGQLLRQTPGHEKEGEAMLRRTAALGVERVFPVTDAELAPYK